MQDEKKDVSDLVTTMLTQITKGLVDHPDEVTVTPSFGDKVLFVSIKTAKEDMGQIIGKHGKTADAIRTLASSICAKNKFRVIVEIADGGE